MAIRKKSQIAKAAAAGEAAAVETRIWSYKVKWIVEGKERIEEQIRYAHRYWNQLATLQHEHKAARDAVIAARVPALERVSAVLSRVRAKIRATEDGIKARNVLGRKKTLKTPEERTRLRVLGSRKKKLDARKSALHATAWSDPDVLAKVAAIDAGHEDAVRAARAACEAYWGSYLRVEAGIRFALDMERKRRKDVAMGKARPLKPRKDGKPRLVPAHRRWPGGRMAGRIVEAVPGTTFPEALACLYPGQAIPERGLGVQIQKGATWAEITLGRNDYVRVEVESRDDRPKTDRRGRPIPQAREGSRRVPYALVWIRVGTAPAGRAPVWAKIRIHLHRQPPPDATVKWVYLQPVVQGPRVRWNLQFVLARPSWSPGDRAADGAVGIDTGWRRIGRQLRVLCAVDEAGKVAVLNLPARLVDDWNRGEELQTDRAASFLTMRDALRAWLAGTGRTVPVPDWLAALTSHIDEWRSADRLAALAAYWKTHRFPGDEAIFGPDSWPLEDRHRPVLNIWRSEDRHLAEWAAGIRRGAIQRRNLLYRRFARQLARQYHTVYLEDINYRELGARAAAGELDAAFAREYKGVAAVGTLVRYITEAAAETVRLDPAYTTKACHACGTVDEFDASRQLRHTCSGCDASWDQDENTARNLLAMGLAGRTRLVVA